MNKLLKPALLLAAISVMVIGMLNAGAWFTDSATSTSGSLTSGTLSIDDAQLSTVPLGTITNMAPGDKTNDVEIIIKNNGNLNLAWFGDLVVTGDATLKKAIYIDYALMQFEGGTWSEPDDNFITDGLGSGLYGAWYTTLASSNDFSVVGLDVFDGNNGMGSTPYEFMGALKPGFWYKLTLRFGFAEGAGNEYQTLGPLDISFKADATQITAGALNALQSGFGTYHLTWLNTQIANQTP